jgi:Na+(H+)/acetate symporter ActP
MKAKLPTHWNLIARSMNAPSVCVIAQQYTSATFISLRFHSRKVKFGARFKNITISNFYFFKNMPKSEIA